MPTTTLDILGNRTLDARPDRLDFRDRLYTPPVATLPASHPRDADIQTWLPAYIEHNLILDQQAEGSCTGFGLACVIHYLLWRQRLLLDGAPAPIGQVSTRMLYHLARFYDEWSGEDYDGSSCRGALKAWHRHGVCGNTMWPYLNADGENAFVQPSPGWQQDAMRRRLGVYYRIDHRSVVDIQAAIHDVGAVYVSAEVHEGWRVRTDGSVTDHATLPTIAAVAEPASPPSGHAFALIGYNPTGFVVQNSWGVNWGKQGFAVLPYQEWVSRGYDAWVCALGVPGDSHHKSPIVIGAPRRSRSRGSFPYVDIGAQSITPETSPVARWTVCEAYKHSLVMGNNGRPLNRIVTHKSGADSIRQLVAIDPQVWLSHNTVALMSF